ncbi:CDF family Co(II)/Ni(II) efflux transporter DmeF [Methylopila sp. M107]|uniref:CDF family Co(II)/Ni(II) efflux transporter DmeF n=1 Tax=Methylopila sp. M107 TaxID=1101190 RepID=UPI0003AAA949|nr:CDF family Co(II)/Ni(II) efflux transporter DmeF [Methylopila sp. M107]
MHQSMTADHAARFEHDHRFLGDDHARNQKRTAAVVAITGVAMAGEIAAGLAFGSMALLADGFHMATHAGAIGLAAVAYRIAARRADDPRLAMGAGKVGDLAGFASAVVLGLVSIAIAWESLVRLANPQPVAYAQASIVAALGLAVNLVCAFLLGGHSHGGHGHGGHDHGHGHKGRHGHWADHAETQAHEHAHSHGHGPAMRPAGHTGHGHDHGHDDRNLRGAYLHVLADALTSVVAIGGLAAGWALGWTWVDPAVGVLGAMLIASWSVALARDTARTLVDAPPDEALERDIRARLETGDVLVSDLHLWRVGPGHVAAIVSLVTHEPLEPAAYKERLSDLSGLSHVTVEVNRCPGARCAPG